jgi:hypothetical protein
MPNSFKMQEWVDWSKQNKPIEPLTNAQARFAEKILNDPTLEQMLSQPGDIASIFKSIAFYLKNRDNEPKVELKK